MRFSNALIFRHPNRPYLGYEYETLFNSLTVAEFGWLDTRAASGVTDQVSPWYLAGPFQRRDP